MGWVLGALRAHSPKCLEGVLRRSLTASLCALSGVRRGVKWHRRLRRSRYSYRTEDPARVTDGRLRSTRLLLRCRGYTSGASGHSLSLREALLSTLNS
jgi:hypothetical protein